MTSTRAAVFAIASVATSVLLSNLALAETQPETPRRKIVLIAGPKSHGPVGNGIHDYGWSVKLLKVMLDHSSIRDQIRVEYHLDGFPSDAKTLDDADTIMIVSDGRDGPIGKEALHFASEANLKAVQKQIDRGCGFLTFHFSTFAPDKYARQICDWSGGYFDWETNGERKWFSAIQTKDTEVLPATPKHPILNGVEPFKMREEFYFDIRFAPEGNEVTGLTPIWRVPTLPGRDDTGNIVAWAKERPTGGRGFGTTCGHFYDNWKHENFRRAILNAIAWTAHVPVPQTGIRALYHSHAEVAAAVGGDDSQNQ